jgi:UDP-GlcNAc3NAcA epimerase
MRVATIVGARPQFIKAAMVSRALAGAGEEELLIHTGQHFDEAMSAVFFRELSLPTPAVDLGVGGLGHGAMTGRMLERIEAVLLEQRVDWVLVYGDTNSTLAGALAAVKLHIPVAHVEAGMRSFNRRMPEEINRVLTDHIATLNLVSNSAACKLLAAEGITRGVHEVGDVMFDACLAYRAAAERTGAREALGLQAKAFALATVHRAENTDDPRKLEQIVRGLEAVGRDLPVVLATHPRTRKALQASAIKAEGDRLLLVDPLGYLQMLSLEADAALILTDSGGVQKEALFQGVPCVTLRDETEWVETVELGWNVLCAADAQAIEQSARRMLKTNHGSPPTIYGDGHAAEKVVGLLRGSSKGT